ncbi:MAG: lamin tail domain-containing protein, partial [Anaerolineales bacterium]
MTGWLLLAALGVVTLGGSSLSVRAAPEKQASFGDVVISEFRTRGPIDTDDEFVEIYNRTNGSINIGGWLLRRSNSTGSQINTAYTFPAGTSLFPGQRFLIVGSTYSGSVSGDATVALGIVDGGGIALTLADGVTIIDEVGMSVASAYYEGTPLAQLSGSDDQSYARKDNGCTDTNNNSVDFVLLLPSDPQNSTSIPIRCLRVTNVTSTNGTYIAGNHIEIDVEFSSNVNVTGTPTLLLETGLTDGLASYSGGSGTNVLTFDYLVQTGDVSGDLNYVASNSLWLNGGTITGAVGDADLTLPDPTASGSLGMNNDIVIDNQEPPGLVSFKRQDPLTSLTNADTLTFRVTFDEPVINVDIGDFTVTGTTATVTTVTPLGSLVYDVSISGGNLANLPSGTVGLDLSGLMNITDTSGNPLPTGEPSTDEVYTLDNTIPTVSVDQATGQADPASATPVYFTVGFSEPIDVSSFATGDITQSGSAVVNTWAIMDSG